jgi:hypothetical protein
MFEKQALTEYHPRPRQYLHDTQLKDRYSDSDFKAADDKQHHASSEQTIHWKRVTRNSRDVS